MSFDTIPKDLRGLRACLVCSLVKVCNCNRDFRLFLLLSALLLFVMKIFFLLFH